MLFAESNSFIKIANILVSLLQKEKALYFIDKLHILIWLLDQNSSVANHIRLNIVSKYIQQIQKILTVLKSHAQ